MAPRQQGQRRSTRIDMLNTTADTSSDVGCCCGGTVAGLPGLYCASTWHLARAVTGCMLLRMHDWHAVNQVQHSQAACSSRRQLAGGIMPGLVSYVVLALVTGGKPPAVQGVGQRNADHEAFQAASGVLCAAHCCLKPRLRKAEPDGTAT